MAEVRLPDGSIAVFPDAMPQEEIASIVQSHIGQQNANLPGAMTSAAPGNRIVTPPETQDQRAHKIVGSNLLEGALDLAGAPGTLLNAMPAMKPQPDAPPGMGPDQDAIAQLAAAGGSGLKLPTSEQLISGAKALGMVRQPEQMPRNTGEQFLAAGSRGVGSTAPLAMLSGPAAIAKAALQGAASGVGGEIGRDYLPVSDRPAVSTLAGVLAGQGAAGAAFGAGGRAMNAARGVGNPIVQAYDEIGVTPRLAGDVTGKPFYQGLQAMSMRAPFGARGIHAAQGGAQEFGNAVENVASSLGSSRTLTDAGRAVQQEARDWLQRWRTDQQAAEGAVSAKVPDTSRVDIAPVQNLLSGLTNSMREAKATGDILTNPVYKKLSAAIGSDVAPSYLIGGRATLPWADVRNIRSSVGEELDRSLLARDGNQSAWRRLYGSLSETLGNTAKAAGAADEWAAANAITNRGHLFNETTLSNILNHAGSQNTISPEAAGQFALGGSGAGGSTLGLLRQEMPGAANELGAYKLRNMAAATPGRMTQESPVSATSFSTDINRMSPEARSALFGGIEPKLSALQTVAERGKETFARFGNPAGTAGAAHHAGLLTAPIVIGEAARGGHDIGGFPGAVAAATAGGLPYIAGPIAGNLTSRELLTRYLAAPTGGPPAGLSRLLRAGAALPEMLPYIGETGR